MNSNELNQILSRLEQIERRLISLEVQNSNSSSSSSSNSKGTPSTNTDNPQTPKTKKVLSPEEFLAHLNRPTQAKSMASIYIPQNETAPSSETSTGQWLGWIGAAFVLLATLFLVKLSLDSGWLTPIRQLGLASVLSLVLIGVGLKLKDQDLSYMSLMPSTGLVILYLTVLAGHHIHQLISQETAFALISLVSLLCVFIYIEIQHVMYAFAASLGSYLAPLFLGFTELNGFVGQYLIIISLGFAFLSLMLKTRLFMAFASYFAIIVTAFIGYRQQQAEIAAILLALEFLIFSLATAVFTIKNQKPLTEKESWLFLAPLLIFYFSEYYFLEKIFTTWAPYFSLIICISCYLFYFWSKKRMGGQSLESSSMIVSYLSVILFHSVYLEILPDLAKSWLFVLIILFFSFYQASNKSIHWKDFVLAPLLIIIILLSEFINNLGHLMKTESSNDYLILGLAYVASLWTLIIKKKDRFSKLTGTVLLSAAHLMAMTTLYKFVKDQGSIVVSLAWVSYSVIVMSVGFKWKDKMMTKSTVVTLLLASSKVLVYDLKQADPIVRIVCLLITGALLYSAGFMFRKINQWENASS